MGVHSYNVRCYRTTPGDAGCHDIPAFADSLEDCIELAGQMLLAYAARRTGDQRPQRADLVDDHGQVVAGIRIAGPETVERIMEA